MSGLKTKYKNLSFEVNEIQPKNNQLSIWTDFEQGEVLHASLIQVKSLGGLCARSRDTGGYYRSIWDMAVGEDFDDVREEVEGVLQDYIDGLEYNWKYTGGIDTYKIYVERGLMDYLCIETSFEPTKEFKQDLLTHQALI